MSDEKSGGEPFVATGDTVFGKILRGEFHVNFIYEDKECVVFNDLAPQAPVHFLVVPRKPIAKLSWVDDEDAELLGHLLIVAKKVAEDLQLKNGFRVVLNDGAEANQSPYHLHLHVLGGRKMEWPPG